MLCPILRITLKDYRCVVFFILFILRNGLTVNISDEKSPSSQSRSFQTGLDTFIGTIHSRMRSGSRKHKKGRRKSFRLQVTEMSGQSHLIKDTNFNLPDAVDERLGNGQRLSLQKKQKMPRIYMTKLPIEKIEEEPEIFFTKLLKEKGKSVAVLENVERRTMGVKSSGVTFEEITLYRDDKDNVVISEDNLEHAVQSDQLYQDGLDNLNDRIYNAQEVKHAMNSFKSFNEKTQFYKHWKTYSILDNVYDW